MVIKVWFGFIFGSNTLSYLINDFISGNGELSIKGCCLKEIFRKFSDLRHVSQVCYQYFVFNTTHWHYHNYKGTKRNYCNKPIWIREGLKKYQPSGAGGTRSPPATPHRLQHLTASLIQNGRQGLKIGKTLCYLSLQSTFAK